LYEFCHIKIKTYKEIVNTFLTRQGRKPRTGVCNYSERSIVVDSGGVKKTKIEFQLHLYNNNNNNMIICNKDDNKNSNEKYIKYEYIIKRVLYEWRKTAAVAADLHIMDRRVGYFVLLRVSCRFLLPQIPVEISRNPNEIIIQQNNIHFFFTQFCFGANLQRTKVGSCATTADDVSGVWWPRR